MTSHHLGELLARQMKEMVLAENEETLYFHDGTERPIPHPGEPGQQQLYYSGKKTTRDQK